MLVAFVAVAVVGAGQPEEFHAAFGMEEGAVYRLSVHQYAVSDGKVTKDGRAEYELVYEGADAGGGLIVRARQLETPELAAGAAATGLEPADLLSECEFVIEEDWTITLRNWEELGAKMRAGTSRMVAHRVRKGETTQELADAAEGLIEQVSSTHEGVLGVHGKLLLPYLAGYGYTLTEGEPILSTCEVPNPFGGEPLGAIQTAELHDDPQTPEVEYGYTRVIGPEALEARARRAVEAAGIEGGNFEGELAEEMRHTQLTSTLEWAHQDGLVRRGRSESILRMRHSGDAFEEVKWKLERDGSDRERGAP